MPLIYYRLLNDCISQDVNTSVYVHQNNERCHVIEQKILVLLCGKYLEGTVYKLEGTSYILEETVYKSKYG
jgi:hypothetical protein